jgi:hypothetical protein
VAVTSVACPSCGGPIRALKDRQLAIVLAWLAGFWTWAYTYERDAAKFWCGLGATVICGLLAIAAWPFAFVPVIVWLCAIIGAHRRTLDFYLWFPYEHLPS